MAANAKLAQEFIEALEAARQTKMRVYEIAADLGDALGAGTFHFDGKVFTIKKVKTPHGDSKWNVSVTLLQRIE